MNASNINADKIVADELYSLLDAVDSEYNSLETEWVELKFTAFVFSDDGSDF